MTATAAGDVEKIRNALDARGWAIVADFIDEDSINRLRNEIESIIAGEGVRQRDGATFAVRNLFARAPRMREVFDGSEICALLDSLLGGPARAVRAILFDKNPNANWRVGWHQDTTIAVRERRDVPGFGPWSVKAGVVHVMPPADVLAAMLTVRLHLDDCDESNGALMVAPGSHREGFVAGDQIARRIERGPIETCCVKAGGALLMRPLLQHASAPAQSPANRRVIHVEFANRPLSGGLEWARA